MKIARLGATAALLAMGNTLSAQVVTNGGFEVFTGTFGSDGAAQLSVNNTQLTGWTVIGGEIAVARTGNVYGIGPRAGNNFLDLEGYTQGVFPKGVSQALTGLSVGQVYTFSMWLGVFDGACPTSGQNRCNGPVTARATIGSASAQFTAGATNSAGNQWVNYAFDFVASNTTMLMMIEGISVPLGNVYMGLDDVSVVAKVPVSNVPEPSTYALMAAGLAVLGVLSRRTRHVRN